MSANAYHVQTGLWTNRSTGVWTLTLDFYWGSILSAALVIYVGIVATLLWIPIKFFLHQILTFRRERPAFIDQLLVTLRNSGSPIGFSWSATLLIWRWRRHRRAYLSVPLIVLAMCVLAGDITARILVVKIYQAAGDEVRLSPHFCGLIRWNSNNSTQDDLYRSYIINNTLVAQTRVDQCSSKSDNTSLCGVFTKPYIAWKGADAKCFMAQDDLCIQTNSTPYMMDSGYMHSSRDLGINAEDSASILMRRLTTCSPVHTRPFFKTTNVNQTRFAAQYPLNDTMQLFFLGPDQLGVSLEGETFFYSEYTPLFPIPYAVSAFSNQAGFGWTPNATFFNRNDADASLFSLMPNHVTYTTPVYDPSFLATEEYTIPVNNQENLTLWAPSHKVSAMVCMDQYQICNTNATGSTGCTPLTSHGLLNSSAWQPDLQLNFEQLDTVARLTNAMNLLPMAATLSQRSGSGLLASRDLAGTLHGPLPIDQWRTEVGNMFSIQLNIFQQNILDFVAGPRSTLLNDLVESLAGPVAVEQCRNQRISSANSGFKGFNFNFTALVVVLCVGFFVGIVSLFIDDVVGWIQKHTGDWRAYQREAWNHDHLIQLHKGEVSGRGVRWDPPQDEDERIPVTNQKVPIRIKESLRNHVTKSSQSGTSSTSYSSVPPEEHALHD